MRPSWNQVRRRAAAFADSWEDASYERGEAQTFYNEFFEVFGLRRRDFGLFEAYVKKLNDKGGYIDLFWPNTLIAEHKSLGGDLEKARKQALDYCLGVSDEERPRFLLACDFQNFVLRDLSKGKTTRFQLAHLPDHVEAFSFMLGLQERVFHDQDPVNVQASERVAKLHDALEASEYRGHDLERYLVRIVFCLFADDTGIFNRDSFLFFIQTRTRPDGLDTGPLLNRLFQVLNTPTGKRPPNLDEELAQFPYINGDLFAEVLPIPDFDSEMRKALLGVCKFDWSNISPAIFGTLFQSVMDPKQRRIQGGHYTIEKNILKVIDPLFMDDLRGEFEKLKSHRGTRRRSDLQEFQKKLGALRLFDPACGCGNFLVVAYRELRELELEVIRAIRANTPSENQQELDAVALSVIDVDQFYGIEIEEFPTRIAEAAMWMMDHIMNNRLSMEFGQTFARIPLTTSPHIRHGDALETDWGELLPPEDCSFVLGNPPFGGAKAQSAVQRDQVRRIAALEGRSGTLDYVAAWFIKAGEYLQSSNARIGFVATNSITQGEQAPQLWPILFERFRLDIGFAHRTFAWESNARGKAHVHVVILGLDRAHQARGEKRLFHYREAKGDPYETQHKAISPYLFDAEKLVDPQLTVREENRPINGLPRLKTGVQMIDNGILTFTQDEYEEFIRDEPGSKKFFRKYIGGDEYINGFYRWILYLADSRPSELRDLPEVRDRIRRVREYRASRRRPSTVALAAYPTKVGVDERLSRPYLVLPNTSSKRREYIPIGWLTPDVIANQKLRILPDATLVDFALLTSAMHMAWMRAITGRMKSDYMYSVGVIYNTFPIPPQGADLKSLEPLAQAVLNARTEDPDATLAVLYDPDLIPQQLRKAHQVLDRAVDRLYRPGGFESERDRVDHLFGLYAHMRRPLDAEIRTKQKLRRTRRERK